MIIGFAGKKQSGKNTAANVLHGEILSDYQMVQDWNIDQHGKLWIETKDAKDNVGWGEFDVTRKDEEFVMWAERNMYPYIKCYSFADALKSICHNLFGLTYEQCYGTDDQKNTIVPHLLWENMPGVLTDESHLMSTKVPLSWLNIIFHEPGPMTAREFMQFFGTNICRKMHGPIWINATINKIRQEGSTLSIIPDVRFPNEVEAIRAAGGKIVKLTRQVSEDNHESETALNNYNDYDYVIDNQNMSLDDFVAEVKKVYQRF